VALPPLPRLVWQGDDRRETVIVGLVRGQQRRFDAIDTQVLIEISDEGNRTSCCVCFARAYDFGLPFFSGPICILELADDIARPSVLI
jgi:hypothetical protein